MKPTKHKKIRLTTTLALLREHGACTSGYRTLCKSLGVKWPDTKPINLLTVLKSNDVKDMLWCIRATEQPYSDHWQLMCKMYADFAESVLPLFEKACPNETAPRRAIEAARSVKPGTTGAARAAGAAGAAGMAAEAAWAAWAAVAAGRAARAAGGAAEAAGAAGAAWAAWAAGRAARAAGRAAEAAWAAGAAGRAAWAAGRAAGAAEEKKQAAIIRKYLR